MCVTPRSASINKRFKLSWYICPIRRRDRYNNISPFILLNYPINIVILNTFCCIMTSSTSFAKFYIIIINTYVFNIMFLFQTSSNYINNFCCCSISYRTTIHYQYFHFDLRFHVPYFYMIPHNHPSSTTFAISCDCLSINHRLDKRKSPINGLFTPFMKLCLLLKLGKLLSWLKLFCLSFVENLPIFYLICTFYFGLLIFCCQSVAISL